MKSTVLHILRLIALLPLSQLHVVAQIGDSNKPQRHELTVAQRSKGTVKSQHLSDRSSTRIPFELSGNQIFLRGRVNGSPRSLWFLLDSGASRSVLDIKQAQRLGLRMEGEDSGSTPVGSVDFAYIHNVSFNLNGLSLSSCEIVAAPLGSLATVAGRRIDGIIGHDLFQHHVIELNYQRQVITVHDPQDFNYPPPAETLDIVLVNNIPFVRAGVRQTSSQFKEGYFELDTGATDFTLYKSFVDAHQLLEPSEPRILVPIAAIGGSDSVGTAVITRLAGLRLGGFLIDKPPTTILERNRDDDTRLEIAGLIGGEILRRFNVILDYPRQRVTFVPNTHLEDPFQQDRSGMSLIAEGNNFAVTRIYRISANSPAAEAGLRVGDVILAIDGRATSALPLAEERRLFTQEVKGYNLTVRRGATTLQLRLNLRKLI